jgi:hypothetical protein
MYYSGVLELLERVDWRGWAYVGFLFWDHDMDGLIKSNDIFEIFKEFNNFNTI